MLESSSPGFQPGAKTISATNPFSDSVVAVYLSARKKPGVLVTPGLDKPSSGIVARRHMRSGGKESIFPPCSCPKNWAQNNRG